MRPEQARAFVEQANQAVEEATPMVTTSDSQRAAEQYDRRRRALARYLLENILRKVDTSDGADVMLAFADAWGLE